MSKELSFFIFFFFQAEDGIRDGTVTGVQTCALPICNVVREVFVSHIALDISRATMALHFHGDHFPRFGKLPREIAPFIRDCHKRSVEQHHGLTLPVYLVVHFEPVNRRITRNRLLLPKHTARQNHRQHHRKETGFCLHIYRSSNPNRIAAASTSGFMSFKALNLMQYPVTLALPRSFPKVSARYFLSSIPMM